MLPSGCCLLPGRFLERLTPALLRLRRLPYSYYSRLTGAWPARPGVSGSSKLLSGYKARSLLSNSAPVTITTLYIVQTSLAPASSSLEQNLTLSSAICIRSLRGLRLLLGSSSPGRCLATLPRELALVVGNSGLYRNPRSFSFETQTGPQRYNVDVCFRRQRPCLAHR